MDDSLIMPRAPCRTIEAAEIAETVDAVHCIDGCLALLGDFVFRHLE